MSAAPSIALHHLGHEALAQSLASVGAPHLPQSLLSDHYATGNAALHRALEHKIAHLLAALAPTLAQRQSPWHQARADVLALDLAFVEHARQPFELAWVEVQAFTSMLPTFHTLHLAQRRLHRRPPCWLPHAPALDDRAPHHGAPHGTGWVEQVRQWVAPVADTVLIEERPHSRFNAPDLAAARHWWQVDVHDWSALVPAHGQLLHPGSARRYRHVWNRLILADLPAMERRRAEATLIAADRVGWHSHPAWYEGLHKGHLAGLPLAAHEACHWVEQRPSRCRREEPGWVAKAVAGHSGQGLRLHPTEAELDALPAPRQWIVQRRFRQRPIGTHPDTGAPLFGEIRCLLGLAAGQAPWVMAWMLRLSVDGVATLAGRHTQPGEGMTMLYFDTESP